MQEEKDERTGGGLRHRVRTSHTRAWEQRTSRRPQRSEKEDREKGHEAQPSQDREGRRGISTPRQERERERERVRAI